MPPQIDAAGSPGLILIFSGTQPYSLPFPLSEGSTELGREELRALEIDDDRVSRRHVAVECTGNELKVRDIGSTNGVFVDGARLPGHAVLVIERGKSAVLRIGHTMFLIVEKLAAHKTTPRPANRDRADATPLRREEIPFLIQQAVAAINGVALGALLIETCLLRPWPGGADELRDETRAAASLAAAESSHVILPRHLSAQAGMHVEKPHPHASLLPQREITRLDGTADAALPETLLRRAGEVLGLSHKTILKLLPQGALIAFFAEAERQELDHAERTRRLRSRAAEALLLILEARDYNHTGVAEALGTSRTTLLKLMEDLHLPRAADLDAAEIERARVQAGGDLDAAARLLHVSGTALRLRLAELRHGARSRSS